MKTIIINSQILCVYEFDAKTKILYLGKIVEDINDETVINLIEYFDNVKVKKTSYMTLTTEEISVLKKNLISFNNTIVKN